MAAMLAIDPSLDLLALWADRNHVHAIFRDALSGTGAVLPASVAVTNGAYPSLSPVRPAVAWFEHMIRERWSHVAEGGRQLQPWFDRTMPAGPAGSDAGRLSFHVEGMTVSRIELRSASTAPLLAQLRGKPAAAAADMIADLFGDSSVAHGIAFAHAVEAAAQVFPPERAVLLRAALAELERLAIHLADLAAITEMAGLALLPARFGFHSEAVGTAAGQVFGEPREQIRIIPGGVSCTFDPRAIEPLIRAIEALELELPRLALLLKRSPGRGRLVGLGPVRPQLAGRYAAGGVIGRASGRSFDTRLSPGYPPYAGLDLEVPVRNQGDVDARLRIRMDEALESCRWLRGLLGAVPSGPLAVPVPEVTGEGIGVAEGARGDIWHWVRLEAGIVAEAFPRDTSWLQWPVLEAVGVGSLVADFPLIEKSLNCSYFGMDL